MIGVKANALFFRKGLPTGEVLVYDHRTNIAKITKSQPIIEAHFDAFVQTYGALHTSRKDDRVEDERFRCFTRDAIAARGDNLDITWMKDESNGSCSPEQEPEELLNSETNKPAEYFAVDL